MRTAMIYPIRFWAVVLACLLIYQFSTEAFSFGDDSSAEAYAAVLTEQSSTSGSCQKLSNNEKKTMISSSQNSARFRIFGF